MTPAPVMSPEQALALARAFPRATPHPLMEWMDETELAARLAAGEGDTIERLFREREDMLARAQADPAQFGFELEHWAVADAQLREDVLFLFILGGNRSAKSEYCAKRVAAALLSHRCTIICLSEDIEASIKNQQQTVWKYLPPHIRALQNRRDRHARFSLNYRELKGFTDRKAQLPNGSTIHFRTYNESPDEVEGWMFGAPDRVLIGGWADENLRKPWLDMFERRFRYQPAQLLWSYTPIHGMTPTIAAAVGAGRVIESRVAELLPQNRVHVPGLPPGHMPFLAEGQMSRSRVLYFFSEMNPFGSLDAKTGRIRSYYEGVKELCRDRAGKFIQKMAYGYTQDTAARLFPLFSPVNIIAPEDLPAEGTNYMLTDPAEARNFAAVWFRCYDGKHYLYRDWPDEMTYGEWAVPTEKETSEDAKRGWDGDRGPAQNSLGWGYERYKREWRTLEGLAPWPDVMMWRQSMRDPYRRRRWREVTGEDWTESPADWARLAEVLAGPDAREDIYERLMDVRAAEKPLQDKQGTTTLFEMFSRSEGDEPAMHFHATSGERIITGVSTLNQWLDWNPEHPDGRVPRFNEPKLYIVNWCRQALWAFQNYTGRSGQQGACKEWIDMARYYAVSEPVHLTPELHRASRKGGSY